MIKHIGTRYNRATRLKGMYVSIRHIYTTIQHTGS